MQRYFAKEKNNDKFILESLDYHHIKNVMRMQENDKIEVVYESILYLCEIKNINDNLEIIQTKILDSDENKKVKLTLCIPYLKEQKLDFIIQKSTELGVDEIILIPLDRSVIKIDDDTINKKLPRWLRIAKEASEQSKRLQVPNITPLNSIEYLKTINGLNLICLAQSKCKSIKNIVKNVSNYDKINVVIGPEGGFSSKEEKSFIDMNFIPISLGNRILRCETAPLYVLSVLNYELME
jgi:16S rRNA (uracil1498-N3)-methyltransferase